MKKILMLIAVIMMAVNASAVTTLNSSFNSWGDGCTVDGNTITYSAAWKGAGYWLSNLDLSDCDYIWVTMADGGTADVKMVIQYTSSCAAGASGTSEATAAAGSLILGAKLDPAQKNDVAQFFLQATTAGSITVTGCYAGTEAEFEEAKAGNKQQRSDLSLANLGAGWSSSYDAATKTITYEADWAGRGWWLGSADYSDFDNIVIKFAEPLSGYCQVNVEYAETSLNTTTGIEAGRKAVIIPLDETGKSSVKQIYIQNGTGVTSVVLSEAYVCTATYLPNCTVVAFGTTTDTRQFTAQTVLAGVNGWESEVLPDGNRVAITQTPAGMGKFWNAQPVMGTWSNEAALAEFNAFTGIEIADADLSEGSTLKVAANSNGSVAANLDLYLDAQTEGQDVTLYTTAFGWNCPLDAITVTGLDKVTINYATNDGNGFVTEPTFTQVNQGINLLKITGRLAADKHVQVTSPTVCEVGNTKVGFQLAAYKVVDHIDAQATVAFGTTTDTRAFTAQTVLAGVNGWESEALPDGNRVAITQTPAGMGKFWNAQPVKGTWSNEAALAEFNAFTGIEITDADLSEGSTLKVAANSNGSVAANLDLYLDAQTPGQLVTLYTTAFGWNCPLDAITVTGLDNVKILYATNDGDGFVTEPTFTQVNQGINLFKITGILTVDKHVQVTSPTVCEVGNTKVGFQLASYMVEDSDAPVVVASWTATACAKYPINWGWETDQVISGYDCTIEKYSDDTYKVLGWDGIEGDDFVFTEGYDDWGYPITETVNGVSVNDYQYATLAYSGTEFNGVWNYVPYNYVEGLGDENGYIILYNYFGDTWGTAYLAWGNYIYRVAEAYTAETPEGEPCVSVQFNEQKTCFYDTYKSNNVDVTLVDAEGNNIDFVKVEDNYCLADYSCDVTSFVLAEALPAGEYTLTIPAGAMVVDAEDGFYQFNPEEYVCNFKADGTSAAKLVYRNGADGIENVTTSSASVMKSLRNGKIVIVKGEKEYNVAGALLK